MVGATPERRQILRRSALFARLPDDEIDAILKYAAIRRYAANAQIFCKGDPGSSMMAVLRGRVVIRAPSSEGKEVILNIINEGEIFGEIALLNLDFVTRLERCGQTADAGDPFRNRWFAATRLPSFGAASELGRSILAAGQPSSFRPTDRGCEAAIQGDAAHRRIRRRDQGRAVGDESASRNWKFESTSLQQRVRQTQGTGMVSVHARPAG